MYVYRCETATGVPRLDASGVGRWRFTYRIRHPRRGGHLHVRGDKTVTWYCLPVNRLTDSLAIINFKFNVSAVLPDVVFVQNTGRSVGSKPSVFLEISLLQLLMYISSFIL